MFPKPNRQRVNLTVQRIASLRCAPGEREAYLWDAAVSRFGVRAYPSGRKTYLVTYRSGGGGRKAPQRKLALGDVDSISLADARKVAKQRLGEVAAGGDPSAARHEARRRERALLSAALDRYEQSLARRRIVKRKEAMSLLRRELLGPLGNIDLVELDRPTLVARIAEVEDRGRLVPGAEAADHHPDLTINYRRVTVVYTTHSAGGLTEKDLAGARMAEEHAGRV